MALWDWLGKVKWRSIIGWEGLIDAQISWEGLGGAVGLAGKG